jgi:MFS family permease
MSPGNASSPRAPRRPLPRAVWVLSWVSFLADVSGEMVSPLLPLFLVGVLGASRAHVGLIEGAAVLIVAMMTAYAGLHSDRTGRRVPWVQVGYGLPVLGKGVIALASVWPMVMGGRLLDRFGKGLRGAPRDALIADSVPADQRGRAFGVHRALDTAGALLGVLLSALLLWWFSHAPGSGDGIGLAHAAPQTAAWVYRMVFGVAAGLGLAAFAVTFLVQESPAAEHASRATTATPAPSLVSGVRSLPRSYWLVLAVLLLFSLANSADAFLLLRASDLGLSPWQVAILYAVFNVTYAAFSYPAGVLSDRLGRWGVIAAGWAIYAGVYAGFAWLSPAHAWGLWPLMACYGVSTALTDGVGKALIADHAPRQRRGTALGIFYASTGTATLGASLLAGIVWDRAGPAPAFMIGSGFAMVALGALGVLWVAERRHAVATPAETDARS